MRATDIARVLASQVERVVVELLPAGKRTGQEWTVGSVSGEAGKSMGVHLSGDKAGVWIDRATGQAGDLIGLWMEVRGLSLAEACKEAMQFANIRDDAPRPPPKVWKKPTKDGVHALSDEHRNWLTDERKIPAGSVAAYRLASRGARLMFPYLADGELIFAKYRTLPKVFSADEGCEPILFGWQAIPPTARAVAITEGELDAIAMHAYGFPALSVPTGAGAHGWIEREFDRLARFDTLYLVMDGDPAGQKAIPELVERLGRDRTRVVTLPHKDANECLCRGVQAAEIIKCMRDAKTVDPSELRGVGDFEDEVIAEYARVDDGHLLPWKKTHESIRLRDGETSIWAGINGHGKSAIISQVVGNLAVRGVRSCVASMEFRTPMWLMRMNRQIAGVETPTESFARSINRELAKTMRAFHVAGSAKAQRILEVFSYARRRYQTQLFVIDNLTKCGFADDDYASQKRFVEALTDFARDTGTHVMLVAHMRKGETEDKPCGKFGVKGSGGITDMSDTVIEVWRNKPRERALAAFQKTPTIPLDPKWEKQSDTMLVVHKQRANGQEPMVNLWFDKTTTQFLSSPDHKPQCLMERSVIAA